MAYTGTVAEFVREHPEGVTTQQIATAFADKTETVERRLGLLGRSLRVGLIDGRWVHAGHSARVADMARNDRAPWDT